ncbi:MAG: DUF4355 domain-containing protein [Clostridiales bacterium]|nr:DUF4355 domain-containing protein [Clostridiales bacterium]
MEETPIVQPDFAPVTAASVEQQLADLARKLTEQLEANRQTLNRRQESMEEKEQELTRRELAAKARDLLRRRQLPEELADCLSFADEEAIEKAVDALEEAFRAAVQQGVEERLLTDAPKTGALVPLDQLSDEEYYAAVCRND